MAEPQSLPTVEVAGAESDYRPVSGVAVAALLVACAFLVLVLGAAVFAIISHRPVMSLYLLLPAGLGIALAVAGRLHIRRSEQTRTGMLCVNVAWWMSVLGGVGYGAYIYANIVAVRQQSENAVANWFESLKKHDIDRAFFNTLAPQLRQNINPNDPAALESRFGSSQLPTFRNSELVRFFQRNGNEVEIKSIGMGNLDQIDNGYRIDLTYMLKSPEGRFEVNLALLGLEGQDTASRDWQIGMYQSSPDAARDRDGSLTIKELTPYGWVVLGLQEEGFANAQEWLTAIDSKQVEHAVLATLSGRDRSLIAGCLFARRLSALLPNSLATPIPATLIDVGANESLFDILAKRGFFKVEGGDAGTTEKKNALRAIWDLGAFGNVGAQRLQNPDKMPRISIAADKIEYALPIEMRLPGVPPAYAAGRLILGCDSPELVKEVQGLKASAIANPEYSNRPPPLVLADRAPRNWRVLRLETNLETLAAQTRPSAP